jgi:exportin-T
MTLLRMRYQYKRSRKISTGPLDNTKRSFLTSLLSVILEKLKWEEADEPDDMDEDDKAAFEGLRKVLSILFDALVSLSQSLTTLLGVMQDLRTFMDAILIIDQDLVTGAVCNLALSTLSAYQSGSQLNWSDAELAIYLVFIFGEINKCRILFDQPI